MQHDRLFYHCFSLRSRRLEVAGERENGRARGRHVFSCAHYFQAPATQATIVCQMTIMNTNKITKPFIVNANLVTKFAYVPCSRQGVPVDYRAQ